MAPVFLNLFQGSISAILRPSRGQATIEYLLLLLFVVGFALLLQREALNYIGDSLGGLTHVLSQNLSTGVCAQDCFFQGYENGFKSSTRP